METTLTAHDCNANPQMKQQCECVHFCTRLVVCYLFVQCSHLFYLCMCSIELKHIAHWKTRFHKLCFSLHTERQQCVVLVNGTEYTKSEKGTPQDHCTADTHTHSHLAQCSHTHECVVVMCALCARKPFRISHIACSEFFLQILVYICIEIYMSDD